MNEPKPDREYKEQYPDEFEQGYQEYLTSGVSEYPDSGRAICPYLSEDKFDSLGKFAAWVCGWDTANELRTNK